MLLFCATELVESLCEHMLLKTSPLKLYLKAQECPCLYLTCSSCLLAAHCPDSHSHSRSLECVSSPHFQPRYRRARRHCPFRSAHCSHISRIGLQDPALRYDQIVIQPIHVNLLPARYLFSHLRKTDSSNRVIRCFDLSADISPRLFTAHHKVWHIKKDVVLP